MNNTVSPARPLIEDLRIAHDLMMQCAATTERLLGRDWPPGSPPPHFRAQEEAARMAGLFAGLGEGYERAVLRQARLPVVGALGEAASTSAAAPGPRPKLHAAPGARRGRLRNGNASGDYLRSPRCGARTRTGCCCRQPATPNGRCRLHGGLSTGPRTSEGLGISAGHGVHRPVSISAPVGAAPHGRPRPGTIAPKQGAHIGAPLRKEPVGTAGHGVHRSDSVNRRDAEAQRARVVQSHSHSSSSVSLRLCGQSSARHATLSAGHGLHRSFRDHLRSSAFIGGSPTSQPHHPLPAGHGLHRPESRGVTMPAGLR